MTKTKRSRPVEVSLQDVVAQMDLLNDESTAYLNRRTGELVTVTDEEQRLVEGEEDPDNLPDWQSENLPKVREVLGSDEFLALPDKFEIHEYRIMERFTLEREDTGLRDELLQAIRGRGAFRRFKEVIHERGVAGDWYTYREQALEDIATEWLEANGIAYGRERQHRSDDGA
jgi:hypothetical protein